MKTQAAFIWACLALAAAPAGALSVRSPAKEIELGRLRVGGKYSLAKESGGQAIANNGGDKVRVRTRLVLPGKNELSDGYEPMPSLSWIKASAETYVLKPGQEVAVDASIAIPKRRGLEGGQYQVQWISEIEDQDGAKMSLTSRLLLDVGQEADDEGASPPAAGTSGPPFEVSPRESSVSEIPLGQTVDLASKQGVSLKVINPNEEPETFLLEIAKDESRDEPLKPGYEPAPNPHFLSFKRKMLKIGAGKIGTDEPVLSIPNEERYRGRKWYFTAKARARNTAQTRSWTLYVATSQEAVK